MIEFNLKRIYEPYDYRDGYRVLVDRLWPRGVSKEGANLDEWARDVAPSSELRKWFGHKPERFEEFKKSYIDELRNGQLQGKKLEELLQIGLSKRVTLLYGARDSVHNHAIVLREELESRAKK